MVQVYKANVIFVDTEKVLTFHHQYTFYLNIQDLKGDLNMHHIHDVFNLD